MPTLDEKPATAKSVKNRKSLAPALPATAVGKQATATGKKAAATGKLAAAAGKQAGNSQMGIEAQSFYKSPVKKSTKSEKVGGIYIYILFYFISIGKYGSHLYFRCDGLLLSEVSNRYYTALSRVLNFNSFFFWFYRIFPQCSERLFLQDCGSVLFIVHILYESGSIIPRNARIQILTLDAPHPVLNFTVPGYRYPVRVPICK